jgi:dual-specificity kinase
MNVVPGHDSDEGHFSFSSGSAIDKSTDFPKGRYILRKFLGSGTYGRVIECVDNKYQARTAIKLIRRGIPAYREAGLKEIKILEELNGKCNTPKMLREFRHDGHICIVFDLLGETLSAAMKARFEICSVSELEVLRF